MDDATCKASIKTAFQTAKTSGDPFDTVMDQLADDITQAVKIMIASGAVATTGTTASACTAGGAAGTCASSGGLT